MYEWLEASKVALTLAFLLYASWSDYKSREVSDLVWVLLAPSGLTLTVLHLFLTQQTRLLITLTLSTLVISGLSIALFYLNLFGGADAKALIILSLIFPFPPFFLQPRLGIVFPIYPTSIINNTFLFAALTSVFIAFHNVLLRSKYGEGLFKGLEEEPWWRKLLVLVTGYKVEPSELLSKTYLYPLEKLVEEDGSTKRRLRVFVHAEEEREETLAKVKKLLERSPGRIWATPGLPLIVFMTVGFVTTLLLGDIILWAVFRPTRL